MKKLLIAVALLFLAVKSQAADQIVTTLLDHVTVCTQFSSGETKLALLDSVIQVGKINGRSILDLQAGFSGDTAPDPEEPSGANFLVGAFFKVSSLIGDRLNLPEHWRFLNSIEHGPSFSYDLREKDTYISYQVGLAFTLYPIR